MAQRKKIKVEDQELLITAGRAPGWGRSRNFETIGLALRADDSIPTIMKALDAVQLHPESRIEKFEIDLEILCNDEIRVRLGQLFEVLNKRTASWSVLLHKAYSNYKRSDVHPSVWVDVDNMEKTELQMALSVLKSVRHLGLYHQRCLACLPKFDHLESIDLCGTVVPFNAGAVFSYPFAAQVIGVDLSGHSWNKPVFADEIKANVRDMQVDMKCPLHQTTTLVSVIVALPALEKLKVVLPIDMTKYEEPISCLFSYLTNPQSKVSNLSFAFQRNLTLQFPRVMAMIPEMSQLKILEIILPRVHSSVSLTGYIDSLIQALRDSPSIDTILLSTSEYNIEQLIKAIFEFQMACRPRRLMAQISEEAELYGNKTHLVSLIYETLENFDQVNDLQRFSLSCWPQLLQKLGCASGKERMRYYLLNEEEWDERVKVFGLDAIYGVLHRLLGDPQRIMTSRAANDEQKIDMDSPRQVEVKSDMGYDCTPTKKQKLA